MKLQNINKSRYRKHLNIILGVLSVSLMAMAVLFGQLLITLLADGQGSNFIFNFIGVVLAGIICFTGVYQLRHHDFMIEVYYIWQLKQAMNKIYRKLRKIEAAAEEDNIEAMVILNFYYAASSQLFKLDDNMITQDSLQLEIEKLNKRLDARNLTIKVEDYKATMLNNF